MKFRQLMKTSLWLLLSGIAGTAFCQSPYASDSLILLNMVQTRQILMKKKDVTSMMKQFANDATFTNPEGYFYRNKAEIAAYHSTISRQDTITYDYSSGSVELRMLDADNALIYYPWRMDWYNTAHPSDTLYREYGLYTISAQKRNTNWYWIAVTDQHTPEYFDDLYDHRGFVPKNNIRGRN